MRWVPVTTSSHKSKSKEPGENRTGSMQSAIGLEGSFGAEIMFVEAPGPW